VYALAAEVGKQFDVNWAKISAPTGLWAELPCRTRVAWHRHSLSSFEKSTNFSGTLKRSLACPCSSKPGQVGGNQI